MSARFAHAETIVGHPFSGLNIPVASMALERDGSRLFAIEPLSLHLKTKAENASGATVPNDDLYRVVCIENGSAEARLDAARYTLQTGTLLFAARGQRLRLLGSADGWVLFFSQDFFCIRLNRREVFCDGVLYNPAQGAPLLSLPADEALRVRLLVDSMVQEAKGTFSEELIISQLKTLLLIGARQKLRELGQTSAPSGQVLSALVVAFQDAVNGHFHQERSVEAYAARLKVTAQTLNRAVRRELGITSSAHIRERVMVEAKRQLCAPNLSVKEIADSLGFGDASHFSRYFEKAAGCYPSVFRERLVFQN